MSIDYDSNASENPFNRKFFVKRFEFNAPEQIDDVLAEVFLTLSVFGKMSGFKWTFAEYSDRYHRNHLTEFDSMMIKKLFQTHECIAKFANNMVLNGVIQCIHEKINEFIAYKTFFTSIAFENDNSIYEVKGEFGYKPFGICDKKSINTVIHEFPTTGLAFSQMDSQFEIK